MKAKSEIGFTGHFRLQRRRQFRVFSADSPKFKTIILTQTSKSPFFSDVNSVCLLCPS
jgi:hypothetical protein